jgi:cold shock CspA family protein
MRLSGTLTSWKDDRGFGFIAPTHGGAELFVHISAMPRDGVRPIAGEKLTYELGRGKNGKPQAINVQFEVIGQPAGRLRSRRRPEPKHSRPFLAKIVGLTLVLALGAFGFDYQQKLPVASPPQARPGSTGTESTATPITEAQGFKCDGRTHCSQMTSCTEAKYFLKNCPGTQMDGNNDGTPCEQQWCNSPFSK